MHFLNETELQNIIAHDGRQDIFVFHDYYIRSSECDMYDLVHTDVLFSLLQEAADIGAEKAGISYKIMDRLQCAWVLSRVSLRLQRSPGVKERVRIYTWQSGMDRINFFRDFYLFDADGEALGAARSSWNVVSISEHKLLPPSAILEGRVNPFLHDFHAFTADPVRVRANFADFTAAPPLFRLIGFSDIDRNSHVNNTRYIAMCRDAADNLGLNGPLVSIDINYIAELVKGQQAEILSVLLPSDEVATSKVAICSRSDSGHDYFRALLRFAD